MQVQYSVDPAVIFQRILDRTCVVRLPLATAPGECFVSLYSLNRPGGYPRIYVDGEWVPVHHAAYSILVGPAPDGLEPDHLCRIRRCWRIDHLDWVTHRENVHRGQSPVGLNAQRTHCPQGHKYTSETTRVEYARNRQSRHCLICRLGRFTDAQAV